MKKNLFLTIFCLIILNCTSDDISTLKDNPTTPLTAYNITLNYKTVINNLEIRQIIKTKDGNYMAIAFTDDFHIIKLNSNFNIIWEKKYGGSKKDYAESILEDSQGNFVILGNTESVDGNVPSNNGSYDIFLIKIDKNGNLIWNKTFGGSGYEGVSQDHTIVETNNEDLIFIGFSASSDFGIANSGYYDAWIVKVDKSGNILKQKSLGGSTDDLGRKIIKFNNNFLITVRSTSSNNDFTQAGIWVLNIDNDLNLKWKRNTLSVNFGSLIINQQNEIITANSTFTDLELNLLDAAGNITKSKKILFSSQKQPFINQIVHSNDGSLLIIGDVGGGNDQDAVIIKVNKNLEKVGEKFIAGNNYDKSRSIIPIQTNKFIYLLNSSSTNLEVPITGNISSIITEIEEK